MLIPADFRCVFYRKGTAGKMLCSIPFLQHPKDTIKEHPPCQRSIPHCIAQEAPGF